MLTALSNNLFFLIMRDVQTLSKLTDFLKSHFKLIVLTVSC